MVCTSWYSIFHVSGSESAAARSYRWAASLRTIIIAAIRVSKKLESITLEANNYSNFSGPFAIKQAIRINKSQPELQINGIACVSADNYEDFTIVNPPAVSTPISCRFLHIKLHVRRQETTYWLCLSRIIARAALPRNLQAKLCKGSLFELCCTGCWLATISCCFCMTAAYDDAPDDDASVRLLSVLFRNYC